MPNANPPATAAVKALRRPIGIPRDVLFFPSLMISSFSEALDARLHASAQAGF